MRIRKKKISSNNEAEVEVAAKLDGSETEASAKDVTIVVDGETVTNNEAEVEVAVKLDGSETEASEASPSLLLRPLSGLTLLV